MTLYVESNFVLEIALGQEELESAERLLAAAERDNIRIAIPSFALSEPFSRVTRGIRDRNALLRQLNSHVGQLARSSPHQAEVDALSTVPNLMKAISDREAGRLSEIVARLLTTARTIELDAPSFQNALVYQSQLNLAIEDAVMLASVLADLKSSSSSETRVFANRNRRDFDNPFIEDQLQSFGCDLVWSFEDAAARLGVS